VLFWRQVTVAVYHIDLLPKGGCVWTPQRTQVEVMHPGPIESTLWWEPWNWRPAPCTMRWDRETNELFRELLQRLDEAYPAPHYR
jgi:hypothetical protein